MVFQQIANLRRSKAVCGFDSHTHRQKGNEAVGSPGEPFKFLEKIGLKCYHFQVMAEDNDNKAQFEEPQAPKSASSGQAHNVRPPVVVVLGHVDHGKTSLLDTVRKTNVMGRESGGITQHIGAYQIVINGKVITFLDTPGHEAFTAIRSRGAKVADIAILVVAADESVKPQTKEAIKIIKSESMPFVVAINKIDKEGASVQKVKQDLATEDVLVEDWGGKVPVVEISAKAGKNIPELLDMILLVAELEELKEDLSRPAEGVIIESHLDKRKGYVATALVQKGILSPGDWLVTGKIIGKIKSMEDFLGRSVNEARPSQSVTLTGWSDTPDTGVNFIAAYSKSEANELAESNKGVDFTPLFSFLSETVEIEKKTYNLILKADVKSSLEAIESSLGAIKSEDVKCNIVGYDIGDISENDVKTAIATKADIIGFRVGAGQSVGRLAEKEGVKVQTFDVIYELIETIRKNMSGLLEPEISKVQLGRIKVLAVFKKNAKSQIFGGKVLSGKALRGVMGEVTHPSPKASEGEASGDSVVAVGKIGQLQHNKEDVTEVKEGLEAGIRLDVISGQPFAEVAVGDILEIYEEEEIARNL